MFSGHNEELRKKRITDNKLKRKNHEHTINENENPFYKYTQSANRVKRQSGGTPITFTRPVCDLYLKVDPFLYDWVYNREGNSNAEQTTQYLLFYLDQQVSSLNQIVNPIRFYPTSQTYYQGLSFKIYRSKVFFLR